MFFHTFLEERSFLQNLLIDVIIFRISTTNPLKIRTKYYVILKSDTKILSMHTAVNFVI